jgi:hypothetical protein
MTRTVLERSITRRSALRGGVACALASVVPYRLLGENIVQDASQGATSSRSSIPSQPELFAFNGATQDRTAIAVTWPEETRQNCTIRVHANERTWEFTVPVEEVSQSQHHSDYSVFIGGVVSPVNAAAGPLRAVVIEVAARSIEQQGSAKIWAERVIGGSRQRIGTPFLSHILRDREDMAKLYHASSPDEDRAALLQPLSAILASRLRAAGTVANPDAHGRRLAFALLPDVLQYDSRRPAGFTFAAQNGRHPSESPNEVVSTILAGGRPSGSALVHAHRSVQTFPYFQQLTAAV